MKSWETILRAYHISRFEFKFARFAIKLKIILFEITFQMNREKLHRAIRTGDITAVRQLIESPDGHSLAEAKNYYGMLHENSNTYCNLLILWIGQMTPKFRPNCFAYRCIEAA